MVEHAQKKKCCFIVLICTAVGEMITLVTIVVHWRLIRSELMAPREQQVCFPCDKFIPADKKEDSLNGLRQAFDEKRNSTMCCGNASFVLNRLAAKGVEDRYNGNASPEITKLNLTEYECNVIKANQPAAKLMGLAVNKTPVSVGTFSKMYWNSLAPSYAKSGLRHLTDDGSIYVETPGLYYISSQIKIKLERASDTDHTTEQTLRHYINLISHKKGKGTILLENARSPCEMATDASEFTSVIGAVFKLETGDRLYVATSHPERLSLDRTNNYFSMHSM